MKKGGFKFDWPLVGNTQITDFLERRIEKNNAAGTYIFTGPDNLGKTTAARFFAQALLCVNRALGSGPLPCASCPSCRQLAVKKDRKEKTGAPGAADGSEPAEEAGAHGDFHLVAKAKDKKNIAIEQVRELIAKLSLTSFLNSYKIGVIKHADHLSEGAANALLKTLEEPRPDVVIILIASNADALPETIVSRSQVLRFNPVAADTIYNYLADKRGVPRGQAKKYARLCLGRPALAVKFMENRDFYEKYTGQIEVFLRFFEQDVNQRLEAAGDLLAPQSAGPEAAAAARRILEVWQSAVRDLLLTHYGLENLVQYDLAEDRLKAVNKVFTAPELVRLAAAIKTAQDYLKANVSPRTALETVAVGL